MRTILSILALLVGLIVAPAAHGQTTRAAAYSISGQLSAGASIDLTRAVVYLDSDPALDAAPPPAAAAQVAQKDKAFLPNFLVIPRGTDVEFPNWDHISHNVFSRSAAAPAFDLDRYPYGMSKTRKFDKIGIVQVFCNVHPQMRAVIFVTPNVYFTSCDKQGHFQIDNVPAGKYTLLTWHDRCGTQSQSIEVGPGAHSDGVKVSLSESRQEILESRSPSRHENYGVERGLGVKQEQLDLPVVQEAHPAPTSAPTH